MPHLIKIAIAHYQFETIHPFLDGNGRIGRLLITLYLVSNGLLNKPSLYLSDFIERNKSLYYESLTFVRTQNHLNGWLKFFLTAVIETAKSGVNTFKQILELKHEMDLIIFNFGKRSQNAKALVDFLYQKPVIAVSDIVEPLGVSTPTANTLIKEFVNKGILVKDTEFKRNQVFTFKRYLEIYTKN